MNGKYLSDEEMTAHYAALAEKYGGLTGRYKNAVSLILDADHRYDAMDPLMESAPFRMVSTPHPMRKKGFPLDRLSIDLRTGKYYYDLNEQEAALDQLANEACSEKSMRERVQYAPELFLAAVDKETGKIAGTLNGLATNETKFRDAFFDEISLYDPKGENVMLLGLSVLPEYRGQGTEKRKKTAHSDLPAG